MKKNNKRWMCLVHVLPSTLEEYSTPDAMGAFVVVVGDAENKQDFLDIVHDCLEEKMKFPILEIEDVELFDSERDISPELESSIKNLLPIFPIAFSDFCYYTEK